MRSPGGSLAQRLRLQRSRQLEDFGGLATRFSRQLRRACLHDDPALVREDWAARNRELAAFLTPRPPPDFLRHPHLLYQMFVDRNQAAHELPYVVERLGPEGGEIAAEEPPAVAR